MYSRISYKSYQDIALAECSDTRSPCYVYRSVTNLAKMDEPKAPQEEISWCRTIGVLQSSYGHLNICEINSRGGLDMDINIRVSVTYLKSPKYATMIESLVLPAPVQVFGEVQWISGKQVIFMKLIKILTVPKALQMKDIMDQLTGMQFNY